MLRYLIALVSVSTAVPCGAAAAQEFPTRPVRIVTSAVGGTTDLVARLIAQGLTSSLGQQVIVDNRPTGIIPAEIVVKAPPDGYTLLFAGSSLWMMPLLQKVPFDPVKDLAPVTLATSTPNIVVVNPAVPAKSIKELIALANAKPGALNYGSGATGRSSHLAAELFKHMARVNIVRVPYKGQGPAVLGLLGGEVQMSFASSGSVDRAHQSGQVARIGGYDGQAVCGRTGLADGRRVRSAGLPVDHERRNVRPVRTPAATHRSPEP